MMRQQRGIIAVIVLTSLIFSGCAGATAQTPVSEALRRDAQAYAETHNVPLDEAIWRLRTQDPTGELPAVRQMLDTFRFAGEPAVPAEIPEDVWQQALDVCE
jgi:hypothetical protein